ncbi:MAG: NAD(P)H-dependent oxidoreductase [Vicinamibacterales bacterium]|nr:NAD(P)H-dependent oxidoreductase [Vicinamibacterales bacterium]
MPTLSIIVASTREGRAGLPVAEWFFSRAQAHGRFDVELIDLKEVDLPLLDEPNHPRFQNYQHEHTRQWSARIQRSDAFVFVTPEYNYGPSPALLNALDYLSSEWHYKAAAFVSYGGISGGTRAVQATKLVVTTLKMVPLVEAVVIPFFSKHIENGVFTSDDILDKSASLVLDELARWNDALRALRS